MHMLKKLRSKLNEKKGFTLVELIVVIVIIMVLASVLVPNVMKYVSSAKQATVKNNAATILTECQATLADAAANGQTVDTSTYVFDGAGEVVYTLSTEPGEEYVVATLSYTNEGYTAAYNKDNKESNGWTVGTTEAVAAGTASAE